MKSKNFLVYDNEQFYIAYYPHNDEWSIAIKGLDIPDSKSKNKHTFCWRRYNKKYSVGQFVSLFRKEALAGRIKSGSGRQLICDPKTFECKWGPLPKKETHNDISAFLPGLQETLKITPEESKKAEEGQVNGLENELREIVQEIGKLAVAIDGIRQEIARKRS